MRFQTYIVLQMFMDLLTNENLQLDSKLIYVTNGTTEVPKQLLVVMYNVWHIYYSKLFPHHSLYKLLHMCFKIPYLQSKNLLYASNEVTLPPYEINELEAYHQTYKSLFLFVNKFGDSVI